MNETGIQVGDRVKLILDKEISPDNQWHGKMGEVVKIQFDDAGSVTGNPRDNFMFTVKLDSGTVPGLHFRRRDLVLLDEYEKSLQIGD